ncbi:MAG: single-stranded DNA-binding protein, partial [Treponema sp.]|nr:single-stranded DNA-binding protein [Treponema sp.]
DRWTGSDGKPHSKVTIVAEHVEFRPDFKKEEDRRSQDVEDPGISGEGEFEVIGERAEAMAF